jgi:hypothetical protein
MQQFERIGWVVRGIFNNQVILFNEKPYKRHGWWVADGGGRPRHLGEDHPFGIDLTKSDAPRPIFTVINEVEEYLEEEGCSFTNRIDDLEKQVTELTRFFLLTRRF